MIIVSLSPGAAAAVRRCLRGHPIRLKSSINCRQWKPARQRIRDLSDITDILSGLRPNPDFGTGYFSRSTAMRRLAPDRLEVVMEDPSHALAMVLIHDDTTLLDVEARWLRSPMTSCAGADAFLKTMAGCPLTDDLQALGLHADARSHCTHMYDSCRFGIVHIAAGREDRRYDVVLPDTLEGPQPVELFVNGAPRLSLLLDKTDMTLIAPDWLAGAPLMKGFAAWAKDRLSLEQTEELVIVQRAVFVSRGRHIDMTHYDNAPAMMLGPPMGSCFASQAERYPSATRNPQQRPGLLLEDALRFGLDPKA